MYTEKRFTELTLASLATADTTPTDDHLDLAAISPAAKARITALSEILGLSEQSTLDELLDSALGDAHDGFLAAFDNSEARACANQQLKSRVKEILG